MATTRIEVVVLSNDELVESGIKKPVRLTPDGYAGIAYGGAVYPLLEGNVIDVAQPSWEFEDCQHYLITGSPIPYSPNFGKAPIESQFDPSEIQWSLEALPQGIYLAYNSPERHAKRVIDLLETGGIQVQRWDVSHRLAADGKFYDWFARLNVAEPIEETDTYLKKLFAQPYLGLAPILQFTDINTSARLQLRIEALVSEVTQLQMDLSTSEMARKNMEGRLSVNEGEILRLKSRYATSRENSRILLEKLRTVNEISESKESPAIQNSAHLAAAEELLETSLLENTGLNIRLLKLEEQVLRDQMELAEFAEKYDSARNRVDEIEDLERERRLTQGALRGQRRGIYGYLQYAFQRLSFFDDSVDQLVNLVKPSAALRVLFQIDTGLVIGKDVVGLTGWREVTKVATGISGKEMSARIYYKPDGERVIVSLHLKENDKQQRRHIERLRNL